MKEMNCDAEKHAGKRKETRTMNCETQGKHMGKRAGTRKMNRKTEGDMPGNELERGI